MSEKKRTKWQTAAILVGQAAQAGSVTRLELLRLREQLQKWLVAVQEAAEDAHGFGSWSPALDIIETSDEVHIAVELAGVNADDIDLSLEDKTLKIQGEKRAEKLLEDISYLCGERSYGKFERIVSLRWDVAPEAVQAQLTDGILLIKITKNTPRQKFKIKVN